MQQEIDILIQYGKADMGKRLHLFLQFPDLRSGFQEIERKGLAVQTGSGSLLEKHNACSFPRSQSFLKGVYHRMVETNIFKTVLRSLRPCGRGASLQDNLDSRLL
jgi:hypothetical protein